MTGLTALVAWISVVALAHRPRLVGRAVVACAGAIRASAWGGAGKFCPSKTFDGGVVPGIQGLCQTAGIVDDRPMLQLNSHKLEVPQYD